MQWFKFYGQDWLTDLKIRQMSVEDRVCYLTLICLASAADEGGVVRNCDENSLIEMSAIPDTPTMDYNPYNSAVGCLKRYAALQCVTLGSDGSVTILNFKKRQEKNLSGAERQKKYRDKLKNSNSSDTPLRNDSDARVEENRIEKNKENKFFKKISETEKERSIRTDTGTVMSPLSSFLPKL